jgi:hypothetical protein
VAPGVRHDLLRKADNSMSEGQYAPQFLKDELARLIPEDQRPILTEITQALPDELQKEVATETTQTLPDSLKKEVVVEVVKGLPEEEQRAALHTALMNLPSETRSHVIAEALREGRATGHSVVVHFTDRASGVIKELMDKSRTAGSLSAVLTQALAFEKWYRDAIAGGNRVFVDRGRGDFREVKRP